MSIVSNKSIETFLKDSGFTIHSKYLTNTKYVKETGDFGKLYVRTLDRGLKEVSYEQIPKNQFEVSAVVILHSITSVDKLAALLAVLT